MSCNCLSVAGGGGNACGPLSDLSATMQRNADVWRAVSTVLGVIGYALVGSIFLAASGAAFLGAAASITALLGGCTAGGISRAAGRQMSDTLGIAIAACVLVPGAQILLPILLPLRVIADDLAAGRMPGAGALLALGFAAAAADGRVTPRNVRPIAERMAREIDNRAGAQTENGMDSLIVLTPGSIVPRPAEYAAAFMAAARETAGGDAAVDLKPVLRTALARERAYLNRHWRLSSDPVNPQRPRILGSYTAAIKYLSKAERNETAGAWNLETVASILNDPSQRYDGDRQRRIAAAKAAAKAEMERRAREGQTPSGRAPGSVSPSLMFTLGGAVAGFVVGGPVGAAVGAGAGALLAGKV